MALKRALAKAFIKASGWQMDIEELPKKVIILGAPHTSNWDAVYMLAAMWMLGRKPSFLVKDSAVKVPVFGRLVRALGGIAVERSARHGMVGSMVERLNEAEDICLCITPKGTRSRREFWKSGFYRMALETGLPLEFGYVDSATKTFGWHGSMTVTGDVRADMDAIRAFYADKRGIRPEFASAPRLRAEDDEDARDYLLSGLPRQGDSGS